MIFISKSKSRLDQELASQVVKTRKTVISDFYYNQSAEKVHLSIVIPLFADDASPLNGFIQLNIDPEQ